MTTDDGEPSPDADTVESDSTDSDREAGEVPPADEVLDRAGFDADETVLTRRQAQVLALRERGLVQTAIADRLGTSRANVSSVESSARRNVRKAERTVGLAEALGAPVQLRVEPDADIYDLPDRLYAACDEAGIKVEASTPEVIGELTDQAGDALEGRRVASPLTVAVTTDGRIRVRVP